MRPGEGTKSRPEPRPRIPSPEFSCGNTFRHDSGFAMRFPRIVRLRPDKPVSEIDTIETVRQIAAEVAGTSPG